MKSPKIKGQNWLCPKKKSIFFDVGYKDYMKVPSNFKSIERCLMSFYLISMASSTRSDFPFLLARTQL